MIQSLALNGGSPVRSKKWPTYVDGFGVSSQETRNLVNQVLDSGRFFRYDTRELDQTMVGQLENNIKTYLNCKYVLAVSSGTTALALALMSLNLPKGFEVACPTFGFSANPSSIVLAGGIPRLFACDENLNIDLQDLKMRWNDNIKVIMVVHMRGIAQPLSEVINFAREKGVYIIEDAVPALGVSINNKFLGTFGDIGCFSMQSDKTINCGEGGFLVTDNIDFYARAVMMSGAYESRVNKHLTEMNIDVCTEQIYPLYSFRMDELRAAVAIPQILGLPCKLTKYKENYSYVVEKLFDYVEIRKPFYKDGFLGDSFTFFVDDERGNEVARALCAEGIAARCIGATDNIRSFKQWKYVEESTDEEFLHIPSIERTEKRLRCSVDIPLSFLLNKEDLDDLVIAVKKVIGILFK